MSENEEIIVLKFEAPTRQSRGFLKRARQAMVFQTAVKDNDLTPKILDGMVDFLSDYIIEPSDRDEAKGLLWDASQDDFEKMLSAVVGGGETSDDPLAKNADS